MNKIKYKKMAEALAQGRDLKQLFSKEEAKEFIKQQLIRKIVLAISPWIGKIVIVCLVIGVLLAIFFIVFEQLAMLWDGVTKAWGHLWSGTISQVSDEQVSILYYDLLQQGVDFEEIGAVGEHNYIRPGGFWGLKTWLESFIDKPELHGEVEKVLNTDNEREKYTLQYYLDRVTDADRQFVKVNQSKIDYINSDDPNRELDDIIVLVDKVDENGQLVKETLEEAAARMLSEKILIFRNEMVNKDGYKRYYQVDVDKSVGIYLKRYLMAEKETFSMRNDYTIAQEGFKGAIIVDNGNSEPIINPGANILKQTLWEITPLGIPLKILDIWEGLNEETYSIEKVDDENGGKMYLHVQTKKSVVNPLSLNKKVELKDEKIDFDISQYIDRFAMPWQYPFAFHQHTLCPDVGYEVALMAHKYHNLYLQVRPVESGVVKVFDEAGRLISNDSLKQPQIVLRRVSTWYQTYDYDYSKDPYSSWHGVAQDKATNYDAIKQVNKDTPTEENVESTDILIARKEITTRCGCGDFNDFEELEPVVTFWDAEKPETLVETFHSTHTIVSYSEDSEGNTIRSERECNITTTETTTYEKNFIKTCTYTYEDNPVVTITDTVSKQKGTELTGIEAMKALLLPDPEIDGATKKVTNYDQAAKYYRANNMEEKDLLFISTSAQSIIKSLYDLYDGNKYEYEPTKYDDIEHIIDEEDSSFMYDKSTPKYLSLADNYEPVIELIEFFALNGIIDASSICGLGDANSFTIMAQWFISGDSVKISTSGNIVTLATGKGREVTAPVSGTIHKMEDSGYYYIKSGKQGTIYLNNIELDSSIQIGQSVTKGQKIGVTKGDVSYYRTDDAGQEIANSAEELEKLQTIQFSDYVWPVPDAGNITSNFGSRLDPITGKVSKHHGVDIGAKEGTPIVAYTDGEIVLVAQDKDGYGNYIIIKHSDDSYTLYGHMLMWAKRSGTVKKNEVIGFVGSTGKSTGPHLHFEYRTGPNLADAVDPLKKLSNYSYY